MKDVTIGPYTVGKQAPFLLIAGPCVIESEELALSVAEQLVIMRDELNMQVVYKSSYDKANRTSVTSYRGPGLEEGLKILEKVRTETGLPILTDVHTPEEAKVAGDVCDIIQIPAFLARQTDILLAAGQSKACVNVKKAQFMAPWDMQHVVKKIESTGKESILLTDRGTSFGYNQLVSDMRAMPIMSSFGYPVLFDATHSVQKPGGHGALSGGDREFIPTLALASIAAGANGIYMETHPNPEKALSDPHSVFALKELPALAKKMQQLHRFAQETLYND